MTTPGYLRLAQDVLPIVGCVAIVLTFVPAIREAVPPSRSARVLQAISMSSLSLGSGFSLLLRLEPFDMSFRSLVYLFTVVYFAVAGVLALRGRLGKSKSRSATA